MILAILALTQPEVVSPKYLVPVLSQVDDQLQGATPGLPPKITVRADTASQLGQLTEALLVFDAADMKLPPLEVSFFDSPESCGGSKGLFDPNPTPWRISICTTGITSVVAHELAHAWVSANVSRELRSAFLDLRGLKHWADGSAPWNERGTEWAAVVVQQGLDGLPLPPVLSDEVTSRLESFELLTGRVAPVLVEWTKNKDVQCSDRPTNLSRPIADGSGRTCAVSRPVTRLSGEIAPDHNSPRAVLLMYQ